MKNAQEYTRDQVRLLAGKTDVTDDAGALMLTSPGAAIQDISVQNTESVAALGAAGVFNGAWRNMTNYNWFSALALSDQSGTLLMDEADTATPNFTNLVASAVTAAVPANQPSPPATTGQVARIVPTKAVLLFNRVRYINGATLQARFALLTSQSPVN